MNNTDNRPTVEDLQSEAKARIAKALAEAFATPINQLVTTARESLRAQLATYLRESEWRTSYVRCPQGVLMAAFNSAITELVTEIQLEREFSEALLSKLHTTRREVTQQTNKTKENKS